MKKAERETVVTKTLEDIKEIYGADGTVFIDFIRNTTEKQNDLLMDEGKLWDDMFKDKTLIGLACMISAFMVLRDIAGAMILTRDEYNSPVARDHLLTLSHALNQLVTEIEKGAN
jgi:hypothetical protein